MDKSAKILIIGHDDIVENSLYEYLTNQGYDSVISSSKIALNPTIQASVYDFFQTHKPDYVILGSTKSGGIEANSTMPADFIYHNLQSECNVFYAAQKFQVKKVLYFASSCIYPKETQQPISESSLLTGELEKTSEPYAIAKIAGVSLAQSFAKQYDLNATIMVPATVYGPGFDQDLKTSHVMGALIHKFVEAAKNNESEVVVWGSGEPKREFLYIDDLIEASLLLLDRNESGEMFNAGISQDVSIKDLASMISTLVGFKGEIKFDQSKPDGAMQKLLDSSKINQLGWSSKTDLKSGIEKTINWYKSKG